MKNLTASSKSWKEDTLKIKPEIIMIWKNILKKQFAHLVREPD
jgi:hypothetical protein